MNQMDVKRLGRAYKALCKAYEDVRKTKPADPVELSDQARLLGHISESIDDLRYGFGFGDEDEVKSYGVRRVD